MLFTRHLDCNQIEDRINAVLTYNWKIRELCTYNG